MYIYLLTFPVVHWHYRLSVRKDIWLIKIRWKIPVSISFVRALAHPDVPVKWLLLLLGINVFAMSEHYSRYLFEAEVQIFLMPFSDSVLNHIWNCLYVSKGHWLSIWRSVTNLWMRKKYCKYSRKLLRLSSTFISITYFTGWLTLAW